MSLVPKELRSHLTRHGDAKHRFPSREAAAQAQSQTNPRRGVWYSAYLCPTCDGWHVGRGKRPR